MGGYVKIYFTEFKVEKRVKRKEKRSETDMRVKDKNLQLHKSLVDLYSNVPVLGSGVGLQDYIRNLPRVRKHQNVVNVHQVSGMTRLYVRSSTFLKVFRR